MKAIALAVFSLFVALSAAAQTANRHVNLGMDIDEFAAKFDLSRTDTPEALSLNRAARDAMAGKRATIKMTLEGRAMAFVFEERALCEIEITAFNTYAHELQVLTDQLGASQTSDATMTIWDRKDGTRFTLTSREGTGVLRITPTPSENKPELGSSTGL
jgi:hypothetical protein